MSGPYEPIGYNRRPVVIADAKKLAALTARVRALEAERHACPTCNHLATLLVNADACPLKGLGSGCAEYGPGGCVWHGCADEDTADCVAQIVAREDAK